MIEPNRALRLPPGHKPVAQVNQQADTHRDRVEDNDKQDRAERKRGEARQGAQGSTIVRPSTAKRSDSPLLAQQGEPPEAQQIEQTNEQDKQVALYGHAR